MVVTGFLICLQRNAGFFYVCAATAFIFFQNDTSLLHRIKSGSVFFLLSVSGLVAWHCYIAFQPTSYRLTRYPFLEDVAFNASLLFPFLGKILIPFRNWISVVMFALSIITIGFAYNRSNKKLPLLLPLFSFLFYIIGFLVVERLGFDEIDRFLSICLPFFLLLLFFAAEQLYLSSHAQVRSLTIIALILWSLYPLSRTVINAYSWHQRSCSAVSGK